MDINFVLFVGGCNFSQLQMEGYSLDFFIHLDEVSQRFDMEDSLLFVPENEMVEC